MGTLRGWIFARERRDTFLYPLPRCLGFDLLFLPSHRSHPENGSIRRRIRERKCFYSKGRKDRRVNPLTKETAFLFLLPFRIVSYGNSISTSPFVQSYLFMLFSSIKRNQFLSFFYRLENRSKVSLSRYNQYLLFIYFHPSSK